MAFSLNFEIEPLNRIKFPNLTFQAGNSVFELSSSNSDYNFFVDYKPIIDTEFDKKKFKLVLLSNCYLDAENDVFQVYETSLKKRIGWIFPIQILESNDNDYADNQFLNKYKFSAVKELLSRPATKTSIEEKSTYNISDLFHENIIILIVSLETLPEDYEFDLARYLPSLSNNGYYLWNKNNHEFYEEQNKIVVKTRGKKRIKIYPSTINLYDDDFLFDLYVNHLKSINHFLLKFHFLYQVIEYFIEKSFENEFNQVLKEYEESRMSKNDLKEKINHISRERTNIKSIVNNSTIRKKISVDFTRDCKLLLESFNNNPPNNIGDLIYDTRNLVVHRYREIIKNEQNLNLLKLITHELERVINNILTSYSSKQLV